MKPVVTVTGIKADVAGNNTMKITTKTDLRVHTIHNITLHIVDCSLHLQKKIVDSSLWI